MQLVWVSQTYKTLLNSEQIPAGWKSLHFAASPSLFPGVPSPAKTFRSHQKIMWILRSLARGLLINPFITQINTVWLLPWAKLRSRLYSSYPLSRLRNGAYPGRADLFSSCIPLLKFLSSGRISPPFLLSSRQTYVGPSVCIQQALLRTFAPIATAHL